MYQVPVTSDVLNDRLGAASCKISMYTVCSTALPQVHITLVDARVLKTDGGNYGL